MKKYVIFLYAACVILTPALSHAQEAPPPYPVAFPGTVEGVGTQFAVTDSEYLNVTLASTEVIQLRLESVHEMVTLIVEPPATSTAPTTDITLTGFVPNTTYYFYQDDYHNLTERISDENGVISYIYDLSAPHITFIQPRHSTKFIRDDATGGDCSTIGTWDSTTKTCTLTTDLTETVQMSGSIALNGNGHSITGSATGNGIYAPFGSGVTIQNVNVHNFTNGIYIAFGNGHNTLLNSTISHNSDTGVRMLSSSNNLLKGNTVFNNRMGILLSSQSRDNLLTGNTTSDNGSSGLIISSSGGNTVASSTASGNGQFGISLGDAHTNILTGNIAISNRLGGICLDGSDNNDISGNVASFNGTVAGNFGIELLDTSANNRVTGNVVDGNGIGLTLVRAGVNTFTENTISNSFTYGIQVYQSDNPQVYNNNFIGNYTPVNSNPSGAILDQNYWSTFDTLAEGCVDINRDRHCDAPYVFQGGQDNSPWTTQNGWDAPTYCTLGTDGCYSNVMFLPGFEASRLYDDGRVQLWEPDNDAEARELRMDNSGASIRSDIAAKGAIDTAYYTGVGNVYKDFLADMRTWESSYGIVATTTPYDWRVDSDTLFTNRKKLADGSISYLTPPDTGHDPYLIETLKQLAATSKTGKVTIMAHSMGGLVAKDMMVRLGASTTAQYIDKVIFIASPQVGTPKTVGALLHGTDSGLPGNHLSEQTARELANNMPTVYNLLPSGDYFTYVDDPVVTFDPGTLPYYVDRYGTSIIHSLDRQTAFLRDTTDINRVASTSDDLIRPAALNPALIDAAAQFHATVDSWMPPASVQVIQVAGWGIPTTIKGMDYGNSLSEGMQVTASTTMDGDGTVVVPSALWVSGVENYWVDLKKYNYDQWITYLTGSEESRIAYKHASILQVDPLRSFVADVLTNTTFNPAMYDNYITSASPASTEKRLRYELHSPLTLDLYDTEGRHTGVSTTTGTVEEKIPGTYYMELAGVKYLFTDASSTAHIIMNGYATGTFTFKVAETHGDTPVTSTMFQDIPTTPETIVTVGIVSDITTLSPMQIDQNGDGVPEAVLTPTLGGTTYYDTTPPEVTIGFSTTTKRIITTGTDDTSVPAITTTSTSTTITDGTGNTLTLAIARALELPNLSTLVIPSFTYSIGTTIVATTSLRYFHLINPSTGAYSLFISHIKTPTERFLAVYVKPLNKTYVLESKPQDDDIDLSVQQALLLLRKKVKTYSGLYIPSISTEQGRVVIR